MARKKRFGEIKRDRKRVSAAAGRGLLRPGHVHPEDAAKVFPMRGEVYRRRDGRYQGWICFWTGNRRGARRSGQRCGEAIGNGPTDALRRAALDFARTMKGR